MKFLLEPDGTLKYKNSILGEKVLVFNYSIDEDDSSHIVYLQSDGLLMYKHIYNEMITEKKLSKFDTKTNNFNQISILNINGKLNLIYSFTNIINSNIFNLQHIVFSQNTQEKYNIIKYVSKRNDLPFVVDNDSNGNIHLLYNTVSDNFSYIYYTYFNPFKNLWLNNPVRLTVSDKHCEYPSIYIDHKDIIHATWWEKKYNGYLLKYARMSPYGADMYKWKEISIPPIIQKKTDSKIYEIDSFICIEGVEEIIVSKDSGINWEKDDKEVQVNCDSITEDLSHENTDIIEDNVHIDESQIDVIEHIEPFEEIDFRDSYAEKLEQILFNQEEIIILLKKILDEQHLLDDKITEIENSVKSQKGGLKRLFSS